VLGLPNGKRTYSPTRRCHQLHNTIAKKLVWLRQTAMWSRLPHAGLCSV